MSINEAKSCSSNSSLRGWWLSEQPPVLSCGCFSSGVDASLTPVSLTVARFFSGLQKLILMSLYTTGRDERHFSDPNQFRPERWLRDRDRSGQVNSWACLPFGLGARSCIGRRVAEVQMQFLIARVRFLAVASDCAKS